MRQAQYDDAEVALQKALATDPKFWNARFNLAEIPFLRKDWAEARKRFDALLQGNAAELQGDAAQLIQYKILLTYLLQGNENMVDSILARFELSPDTPAANYSNAAIALQHKNEAEAKNLLTAAEKNFSPAPVMTITYTSLSIRAFRMASSIWRFISYVYVFAGGSHISIIATPPSVR